MLPRYFIKRQGWPVDIVLGFHQVKKQKPDPEALLTAMRQGNATANQTYHVGDEADDTKASRQAGVIAIGAAWGTAGLGTLEESKPDYLFYSVFDLHSFFLSSIPVRR